MVTHDPRYAEDARRAVHLFDGRMIGQREASAAGVP
jgi:ABC-type lipoprotein export system ATPase subunit